MPEVEYVTTMRLPPEQVWEFVRDMNNWAPFLTGYQKHEIESETDSIWTLKGDVGILSRVVRLKAHVTEWNGPDKVAFTLTGLNEAVDGGGMLVIGRCVDLPPPKPRKIGLFRRFIEFVFRFFFRLTHKAPPRLTAAAVSQLTF